MSLVTMKSMLNHAKKNKYAVGYFESWNLESLLAVVDAAERTNSPVIIGFGGMFLGNDERIIEENIYHYGSLGKSVAQNAKVPVSLLLNEADKVPMLIRGLDAGFNAIMYQNLNVGFEETTDINKYIVKTAHYCGADVEAEVGELPSADIENDRVTGGELTDPEKAAYFVKETGIDALAVAIGNVHLLEGRKAELDYDLIKQLEKKIDIPLVMHGGTGLSEDSIKTAIELGICKLNVGTVMKRIFINHIKRYLDNNDYEHHTPHEVVGMGGKLDFLTGAREEIAEEVARIIKILGSENKAKLI